MAAKVIITGTTATIEASVTAEEIKTLAKYRPDALQLKDEDKAPIFKVSACGTPCVEEYAIVFGGNSFSSGKACVTLPIPADTEDVVKYVEENYGTAITRLNKVEAQFDGALGEVSAEKQAVLDCIELN